VFATSCPLKVGTSTAARDTRAFNNGTGSGALPCLGPFPEDTSVAISSPFPLLLLLSAEENPRAKLQSTVETSLDVNVVEHCLCTAWKSADRVVGGTASAAVVARSVEHAHKMLTSSFGRRVGSTSEHAARLVRLAINASEGREARPEEVSFAHACKVFATSWPLKVGAMAIARTCKAATASRQASPLVEALVVALESGGASVSLTSDASTLATAIASNSLARILQRCARAAITEAGSGQRLSKHARVPMEN